MACHPAFLRYVNPERILPTTIEILDIAGLVKGASNGEGLGNQFLGHIRGVDAIIHVVRCFEDENIVHVNGAVNPVLDIEIIQTELAVADLDTVDKRLQRTEKLAKSGDRKVKAAAEFYLRVKQALEQGKGARGGGGHPHRFREGLHPRRSHRLRRLRGRRRRVGRQGEGAHAPGREGIPGAGR